MKLQAKLVILIFSILLLFGGSVAMTMRVVISSYGADEIQRIRDDEMTKIKRNIKNYVDIVYAVVESNYEKSKHPRWLQAHYGRRLIDIIDIAEGVIREYRERADKGELSQAEARRRAAASIAAMRYDGGTGYLWINDTTKPYPKMIMHATIPRLNGMVLDSAEYNCALGENRNLFQAAVEISEKDGEGFVDYLWPKPTADGLTKVQPKLSYVRLIPEWNWVIGTGIYVDDALADAIQKTEEDIGGMRYGDAGYFWINDTGKPIPKMIMHPTVPELNGKVLDDPKFNCALGKRQNLFQAMVTAVEKNGEGYVDYLWPKPTKDGLTKEQPKLSYVRLFEPLGWVIGTGVYLDAIDAAIAQKTEVTAATIRSLFRIILIVAAVAFLILVGVGYYVTDRFFVRKINNAVTFAETISGGDLTRSLSVDQRDEIGALAASLNHMNLRLREMVKAVVSGVGIVSASSENLSAISEQMTGKASRMTERANMVAAAAEEMSVSMTSVAAASEQASTNLKMVATATEEMATTVDDIARHSEEARTIAGDAVDQGKSASDKVNKLGHAVDEIDKVTEVITEISEQTNLLALNATIEAARAGEAGKGFAVVANEIKELARQTPEATRDIKEKIHNIQTSTAETVREIGRISDVIQKMDEIVSGIATAVEEQSVVTREIAGNIANASLGIEEVNRNVARSSSVAGDVAGDIAGLNGTVSEMSENIMKVNANAEDLSRLAAQLKELSNKFSV